MVGLWSLDLHCPHLGAFRSPAPGRSPRGRSAKQLRPESGAAAGGGRGSIAPAGAGAGAASSAPSETCPAGGRVSGSPPSPRRQFYDLQTKLQTNPAGDERLSSALPLAVKAQLRGLVPSDHVYITEILK